MTIGAGLRTFLGQDSGIAAIVAALPNSRIYPVTLPQNPTLPAVRYFKVSGVRPFASPQGPLKLSGPRIQIDSVGLTYASAHALAELIRKRLDGYKGVAGSQTVQGAFFANEREWFEPDVLQHWISRDYFVWFEESID